MRLNCLTVSAFCLLVAQAVTASPDDEGCTLPPDLQREVAQKYHTTKLVSLPDLTDEEKKLFQKDHGNACPGLARLDFYGDGKRTFALVLEVKAGTKETAELILAHRDVEGWRIRDLDTAHGPAPVVWSERPGEYRDVYGEKKLRATMRVIVFCGYNSWAVVYAWTGRRVDKVWIRD